MHKRTRKSYFPLRFMIDQDNDTKWPRLSQHEFLHSLPESIFVKMISEVLDGFISAPTPPPPPVCLIFVLLSLNLCSLCTFYLCQVWEGKLWWFCKRVDCCVWVDEDVVPRKHVGCLSVKPSNPQRCFSSLKQQTIKFALCKSIYFFICTHTQP